MPSFFVRAPLVEPICCSSNCRALFVAAPIVELLCWRSYCRAPLFEREMEIQKASGFPTFSACSDMGSPRNLAIFDNFDIFDFCETMPGFIIGAPLVELFCWSSNYRTPSWQLQFSSSFVRAPTVGILCWSSNSRAPLGAPLLELQFSSSFVGASSVELLCLSSNCRAHLLELPAPLVELLCWEGV